MRIPIARLRAIAKNAERIAEGTEAAKAATTTRTLVPSASKSDAMAQASMERQIARKAPSAPPSVPASPPVSEAPLDTAGYTSRFGDATSKAAYGLEDFWDMYGAQLSSDANPKTVKRIVLENPEMAKFLNPVQSTSPERGLGPHKPPTYNLNDEGSAAYNEARFQSARETNIPKKTEDQIQAHELEQQKFDDQVKDPNYDPLKGLPEGAISTPPYAQQPLGIPGLENLVPVGPRLDAPIMTPADQAQAARARDILSARRVRPDKELTLGTSSKDLDIMADIYLRDKAGMRSVDDYMPGDNPDLTAPVSSEPSLRFNETRQGPTNMGLMNEESNPFNHERLPGESRSWQPPLELQFARDKGGATKGTLQETRKKEVIKLPGSPLNRAIGPEDIQGQNINMAEREGADRIRFGATAEEGAPTRQSGDLEAFSRDVLDREAYEGDRLAVKEQLIASGESEQSLKGMGLDELNSLLENVQYEQRALSKTPTEKVEDALAATSKAASTRSWSNPNDIMAIDEWTGRSDPTNTRLLVHSGDSTLKAQDVLDRLIKQSKYSDSKMLSEFKGSIKPDASGVNSVADKDLFNAIDNILAGYDIPESATVTYNGIEMPINEAMATFAKNDYHAPAKRKISSGPNAGTNVKHTTARTTPLRDAKGELILPSIEPSEPRPPQVVSPEAKARIADRQTGVNAVNFRPNDDYRGPQLPEPIEVTLRRNMLGY